MANNTSCGVTIDTKQKILPGRVTIGIYDGKTSVFTAATEGERVLLLELDPYEHVSSGKYIDVDPDKITYLNINQPITCIQSGSMSPTSDRHCLLVGTMSNIFAYDVQNNKDLFFKEVSDDVTAIVIGRLGGLINYDDMVPIAIAGGNCSVQGFDAEGNDIFWTVTGDNVGSIALLDYDSDGKNEMIVGSEDFDIRIFKGDHIIGELSETDTVCSLCPMEGNIYAYALGNGTIGVYEKAQRLWRIKSKNQAVGICSFDFDGDGIPELVTGWSNGKLDVRNARNGEVLFKDNFSAALAGVVTVDLNQSGRIQLVACDVNGEIRIYSGAGSGGDGKIMYTAQNVEQEAIREINMKKHHLLLELRNYEAGGNQRKNNVVSNISEPSTRVIATQRKNGTIPSKTQLQTAFSINMDSEKKPPHVEITLTTNNDTMIRCALIFAEGIFKGECHVVHPKIDDLYSKIVVPVVPPRNIMIDLHIKAYVGYKDSIQYHVFEITRQLPRFAMYAMCKNEDMINPDDITGYVILPISERPSRIVMWINQNFLLAEELQQKAGFMVSFLALRNNDELVINVENDGKTTLHTNDIELAGDIVQSLCHFLTVTDLETNAYYPEETSQLQNLLKGIDDYQESNETLGADISDQSTVIKTLLVRAENARLLGDAREMRKWYAQLHDINRALVTQHDIRCVTNQNISDSIKSVNQIIQKAARLRAGKGKANVIMACRDALKEKNFHALEKIIQSGAN